MKQTLIDPTAVSNTGQDGVPNGGLVGISNDPVQEGAKILAELFPPNQIRHGLHLRTERRAPDQEPKKYAAGVGEPVTLELITAHLAGGLTYTDPKTDRTSRALSLGYLPAFLEDGQELTNVGVFDVDWKDYAGRVNPEEDLANDLARIKNAAAAHGLSIYMERSSRGKGWHGWLFLADPVPIPVMLAALKGLIAGAGLQVPPETYPKGEDANGPWIIMPYSGALLHITNPQDGKDGKVKPALGRTYLETVNGEPIELLDALDMIERSDSSTLEKLAAEYLANQPAAVKRDSGEASTQAALPPAYFEPLKAALLKPPEAFDRHDAMKAAMNLFERMGKLDEGIDFIKDELYEAWITDDSRTEEEWADEVDRWSKAKTDGNKYGIPYLQAQGFDMSKVLDDEHFIAFEDLLARAQAATIATLPHVLLDLRYLADSTFQHSQREAIFQALKEATGLTLKALRNDFASLFADEEKPERETLAEQLLNLVLGKVELWHDSDEEPHITLKLEHHQEHHRLNTRAVRRWLQREWYVANGGTIGREPLTEVLGVLEGKAIHDGEQHEVFLRVAEVGEGASATIYIDMGDPAWHAIEVTAGGWRIIDSNSVPVNFTRSAGMLPLPTPQPGGVADIAAALGIPHLEEDGTPSRPFQGSVAWLLQAFRVRGPFPVLPLFGQQGSGKTTFTKHLCGLLDPHTATLRVLSRDERDILISARHSWLQAKDNVSRLSQWTSDAFCRLATGGAISTRTLYTNDEETILNAKRPVLLNGITAFLEQQDLVDRSISVTLDAIPEDQRLPESELEAEYERSRPKALGALLDIVAAGLTRSGKRHLARLPRMADFAEWIVACAPALGWDPEDFLNWYANTKADLVREALDSSAITPALLSLIDTNGGTLELSASELLAELNHATGISDGKRAPAGWPKRAQSLSNEIRRLQPALLQAEGIEVEQSRTNKARVWRLHNIGKSASPASPQPWLAQEDRPGREKSGDAESEARRHSSSLIVTGDDAVTTPIEAASPRTTRSHRPGDASDASDDQIPTLRGRDELQHRARALVEQFAALTTDQLRPKYAEAAAEANYPAWWPATAKTEPLAVTAALVMLDTDQRVGKAEQPAFYLKATREAVAASPKPTGTLRPTATPPAGAPL